MDQSIPYDVRKAVESAPSWSEIIDNTDVVITTGRRRHGKSALIYELQEILSKNYSFPKYAWGIPRNKHKFFPDDLHHFQHIENLERYNYSVIALDEIHQIYSARSSVSKTNKWLSQAMTFSGQRNQILLLATLNNALIDVNTFRITNPILIYKRIGKLQANAERSATKEFTKNAQKEWERIPHGKKGSPERAVESSLSYVVSDEYIGWKYNELPSWWSDNASEMSRIDNDKFVSSIDVDTEDWINFYYKILDGMNKELISGMAGKNKKQFSVDTSILRQKMNVIIKIIEAYTKLE